MENNGPIIYIDDDPDDQFLVQSALSEIDWNNGVLTFDNGQDAFEYLSKAEINPFLILCDLQMPKMSGHELKDRINETDKLRDLSIPFVFFTGDVNQKSVKIAYSEHIQGFYKKECEFDKLKDQLRLIIEYWKQAIYPDVAL